MAQFDNSNLKLQLEETIKAAKIPGASIAISYQGEQYEASAGQINIDKAIETTDLSKFQIGSITKVFTATLVFKLVEQRLIELNKPVSHYLNDFKIAGETPPDSLTVRSLLDYSAGFEGDFFEDFGDEQDATDKYLEACTNLRFIHPPGEMRSYNSTSFVIASKIIEVVTRKPYLKALSEQLLSPLGIVNYHYYPIDNISESTALGYKETENGFALEDHLRLPYCLAAAGSVLTMSASELLKFGLMHLNLGVAQGQQYLTADTVSLMQTSYKTVPPSNSELIPAWAKVETSKTPLIVASGATYGHNAFLILSPENQFAASIVTNVNQGGDKIVFSLMAQLLKAHFDMEIKMPSPPIDFASAVELPLPAGYLEKIQGTYTNGPDIVIKANNGKAYADAVVPDPYTNEVVTQTSQLTYVGDDKFIAESDAYPGVKQAVEFVFLQEPLASCLLLSNRVFGRKD